jgi:hypothetical protein
MRDLPASRLETMAMITDILDINPQFVEYVRKLYINIDTFLI